MSFQVRIIPYKLIFKKPANTSRGTYRDRPVWYVVLESNATPEHIGIGECAPLFDLSSDYDASYMQKLQYFAKRLQSTGTLHSPSLMDELKDYPSILLGFETAWQHFQTESLTLWNTPFSQGKASIPINGLIWMAPFHDMLAQIEQKLKQGFNCIKLKISAINFDDELKLLQHIRKHFTNQDVTLRVDANGAFAPGEALDKLKRLAELDLHSIEQPIRAKQWEDMAQLVQTSPLPIALDEELIGIYTREQKQKLLKTLQPHFIILKPTLHGSFTGAQEWIDLAQQRNIGWWVTSALESNIGLNAIAQWCATLDPLLQQGLGTGQLYTNNIPFPLTINQGQLRLHINDNKVCTEHILNAISSGKLP